MSGNDPRKNMLFRLNLAAGLLHAASFIAALAVSIAYAGQSFNTEITTDFRVYDANSTGPSVAGPFSTVQKSLGYYPLIWVDLPFPLITAIFHLAIALVPFVRQMYFDGIFPGKDPSGERFLAGNPLRWLEYSITASLMTWVLLQLSGVTNVFTLIVCGPIANIALQIQGHLQEKLKGTSYMPTVAGWLIFLGQWTVILSYFFTAVTSPRPLDAEQVPWFVFSIIIGLFFFFCAFGLVQLAHILEYPRFMKSAYAQDIAYLILSFTSKLFLTWNLLIGIATNGPAS